MVGATKDSIVMVEGEMKEHLEFMYMLARENSSKLLGQIKAIKSVLAHQQK